MVDVKQAVQIALQHFQELFQDSCENIRLEEIEFSDDERFWYVTIGYDPPVSGLIALAGKEIRQYKLFKIDAETGKMASVKIRKV